MTITSAVTSVVNPLPILSVSRGVAAITTVPAFKELPTFTVTVSATDDEQNPWEISGVAPVSLLFGSREVGAGTIYGMTFVLDAPEGVDAIFQTPAITFQTPDAPAFNIAPFGTNQASIIWANTVPVETTQTFNYTLNAIVDGHLVSHDPTVENLPPSTP
jgi:hypothetical protein